MATLNAFIPFILSHDVVLSALVVAVLDLAFALNRGLEANGLLHAVYVFVKARVQPIKA